MILGFKEQFIDPIKQGKKIHTIRKGNRWRQGMIIHFYTKVRKKTMYKFCEDGTALHVQDIKLYMNNYGDIVLIIDGKKMDYKTFLKLIKNDGFEGFYGVENFYKWFLQNRNEIFKGQIIHWTEFKY